MACVLPMELMIPIVGYCEAPVLAALCLTNCAMYTLAAPRLYDHLKLTFRDPDEDYAEYTIESDQKPEDINIRENEINRERAYKEHCIHRIIVSKRIKHSWVRSLIVRYAPRASRSPNWPRGDFPTKPKKGPIRSKGQDITASDMYCHCFSLLIPAFFPCLEAAELPILIYDRLDVDRGEDNRNEIELQMITPMDVWRIEELKCTFYRVFQAKLPRSLEVLIFLCQGDDCHLMSNKHIAGAIGKKAEELAVTEFGNESRLRKVIIVSRSTADMTVWHTKRCAETDPGKERLRGHCYFDHNNALIPYDSGVELLSDEFYNMHLSKNRKETDRQEG